MESETGSAPASHLVVFDVNVYLDVASLLGPPFTWKKFNDAAARHRNELVPCSDHRVDSLRALALATTGRFAGPLGLQVWTSEHIDGLVATKATQLVSGARDEDRGLGWTTDDGIALVEDLVWDLVFEMSEGGRCSGPEIPFGCPPLSHEDGIVYRTAELAGEGSPVRYLVTGDKQFRTATLPGDISVVYPFQWVQLVRRSRFAASAPSGASKIVPQARET